MCRRQLQFVRLAHRAAAIATIAASAVAVITATIVVAARAALQAAATSLDDLQLARNAESRERGCWRLSLFLVRELLPLPVYSREEGINLCSVPFETAIVSYPNPDS